MTESSPWAFTLAAWLAVSACSDSASHGRVEHGFDGSGVAGDPHGLGEHVDDAFALDDGGQTHHVRDVEAEPCNGKTWRELGTDLRASDLAGENLDGANFRRADLSDSDLSGASLKNADLFNSRLVRARLTGTVLEGAKLAGADFTSADLTGASLQGADLTAATFTDAVLEGVASDSKTTCRSGAAGPCW